MLARHFSMFTGRSEAVLSAMVSLHTFVVRSRFLVGLPSVAPPSPFPMTIPRFLLCLAISVAASAGVTLAAASTLPRTILFVDDDDVLYRPGTLKRVVEFKKFSSDPVIVPDKLWEGMIGWSSVYRNPATGKFQLWYQAYQQRRKEDKSLTSVVCYAESDDGRTWTKPKLGLFPFYGETATNIVLVGAGGKEGGYGTRYSNSVVVDPRDPDPARRYKMVYYDWGFGEKGPTRGQVANLSLSRAWISDTSDRGSRVMTLTIWLTRVALPIPSRSASQLFEASVCCFIHAATAIFHGAPFASPSTFARALPTTRKHARSCWSD